MGLGALKLERFFFRMFFKELVQQKMATRYSNIKKLLVNFGDHDTSQKSEDFVRPLFEKKNNIEDSDEEKEEKPLGSSPKNPPIFDNADIVSESSNESHSIASSSDLQRHLESAKRREIPKSKVKKVSEISRHISPPPEMQEPESET